MRRNRKDSSAESDRSRKRDFPLSFAMLRLCHGERSRGIMSKLIARFVADAAFAIAAATLPVLMMVGLVRSPVPVPVRVTEKRRR